jgi:aryl-alcohol dehydrogenase-like predicted oxidoreductase
MDYVRLGRSSLKLSRLGLGAMGFGDTSWRSWVLGLADSRAIFRRAIEAGINFIDTCDYYSAGPSEKIVGTLLAEHGNCDQLVIATKVGNLMGRDLHRYVCVAFASNLLGGKLGAAQRPTAVNGWDG